MDKIDAPSFGPYTMNYEMCFNICDRDYFINLNNKLTIIYCYCSLLSVFLAFN